MTVDEIFVRAYDVIQMLDLMPYLRAALIISVTMVMINRFLNRGG